MALIKDKLQKFCVMILDCSAFLYEDVKRIKYIWRTTGIIDTPCSNITLKKASLSPKKACPSIYLKNQHKEAQIV